MGIGGGGVCVWPVPLFLYKKKVSSCVRFDTQHNYTFAFGGALPLLFRILLLYTSMYIPNLGHFS